MFKAPHLVHVHERGAGVRGQGGGGGEDGEQEEGRGLQQHGEAAREAARGWVEAAQVSEVTGHY